MVTVIAALAGPLSLPTGPSWTDVVQALASAATAAGILVAGGWAMFRFQRGRSFQPRCSISLECATETSVGGDVLRTDVHVINCGDCMLAFDTTDRARVEVSVVDEGQMLKAGNGPIRWPDARWPLVDDVFAIDNERLDRIELEPSQDVRRSFVFRLPMTWHVARVKCVLWHGVGDDRREWVTTKIMTKGTSPEGRPGMAQVEGVER